MNARNDAAEAAEFRRWQGHGLIASKGCNLAEVSFGDATVMVEYEFTAAGGDDCNEPKHDAKAIVINVLVNGTMVSVDGLIHSAKIEKWEDELRVSELEAEPDYNEPERDAVQEMLNRVMDGQGAHV